MIARHARRSGRQRQAGAAALAFAVLLLFIMAMVAFHVHGALLFEQKTSANQYRATRAFEMAEAGIEWATAMLNDPRPIDARCLPVAMGTSFRAKYLPEDAGFAYAPATDARPACRVTGEDLVCSCPEPGANPALGAPNDPSFAVHFDAIATEAAGILVTSLGCTSQGSQCVPGSSHGPADADARVRLVLKRKPLLRVIASAALTAGGSVTITGPVELANAAAAGAGAVIEAGGPITVGVAATVHTVAGSPHVNAIAPDDPALHSLDPVSDGEAMFAAFFGTTTERFGTASMVRRISGDSPAERGSALQAAHAQGFSAFEIDGDVLFDSAGAGTAALPVLIVSRHRVECSARCPVHGLLYVDLPQRDAGDMELLDVKGAVVTRGDHAQAAGGSIAYDLPTLQALRRRTGAMVRVPGSWHDL